MIVVRKLMAVASAIGTTFSARNQPTLERTWIAPSHMRKNGRGARTTCRPLRNRNGARQRNASPLRATIIVVAGSSAEPMRISTDMIEKKRPQSTIQTAVRATGGSAAHSAVIGWGIKGCSGACPQISEAKKSDRAFMPAAMRARSEPPRMKRAPISTYFLA